MKYIIFTFVTVISFVLSLAAMEEKVTELEEHIAYLERQQEQIFAILQSLKNHNEKQSYTDLLPFTQELDDFEAYVTQSDTP